MKFLSHFLPDFSDASHARWIFANLPEDLDLEGEGEEVGEEEGEPVAPSIVDQVKIVLNEKLEAKESAEVLSLNQALENPFEFSLRHMADLEKALREETLSERQEELVRELVGYCVVQATEDVNGTFPSRILLAFYESSNVKGLLSPTMIQEMEILLDQKRQALVETLKVDPSVWSALDITKVASQYRYLKSKAFGLDGKDDVLLEQVRKGLIKRGVGLFSRYKSVTQTAATGTSDREGYLVDGKDAKDLTNEEKILLLEIYKLFPKESVWAEGESNEIWKTLAQRMFQDISKDVSEQNNPYLLQIWEILEEFSVMGEEGGNSFLQSTFLDGIDINGESFEKIISQQSRRSRAMSFLQFANERNVFLPSHLQSLQSLMLASERNSVVQGIDESSFQDKAKNAERREEIKDLESKIKNLQSELSRSEDLYFESLEASDSSLLKTYHEKKKKLEDLKVILDKQEALVKQKKEALEKAQKTNDGGQPDRELVRDEESTLRREQEVLERRRKSVRDAHAELRQSMMDIKRGNDRKANDNEKDKTSSSPSEKKYKEIQRLESDIRRLERQKSDISSQVREVEDLLHLYRDPRGKALNIYKDYVKSLEGRIQSHHIRSADLAVLLEYRHQFQPLFNEASAGKKERAEHTTEFLSGLDNFRYAFSKVLNENLENVNLRNNNSELVVGNPDDRYGSWFQSLEKALDTRKMEAKLKEDGFDMEETFGADVDKIGLLQAGVLSCAQEIWENVFDSNVAKEDQQRFRALWERGQYRVDSQEVFDSWQRELLVEENQKKNTDLLREADRQCVDDFRSTLSHESDKELLSEDLLAVHHDRYLKGHKTEVSDGMGGTRTIHIPGKEDLNKASMATLEARTQFNKIVPDVFERMHLVGRRLQQADTIIEKRMVRQDIEKTMSLWLSQQYNVRFVLQEMRHVCEDVFEDSGFIKEYFDHVEEVFEEVRTHFYTVQRTLQDSETITGNEALWVDLPKSMKELEFLVDFRDGCLAKESNHLDQNFQKLKTGLEVAKKNDLFDGTENKTAFQDRLRTLQGNFGKYYDQYDSNIQSLKERVEHDSGRLNDEKFQTMYGYNKSFIQKLLDQHVSLTGELGEHWDNFSDPSFVDTWLDRFQGGAETRLDALTDLSDWENLMEFSQEMVTKSDELNKWIENYDEAEDSRGGAGVFGVGQHKFRVTVRQFALTDLYFIVKQCLDAQDKKWKRRSDRVVGEMGLALFGQNTAWGKEFKRLAEESEIARVKEFTTQYQQQAGWEVSEALYKSKDPDEVRACIDLLKEKGFLKWEDPRLWRTLMRLNPSVFFRIPDDMELSREALREKIEKSCNLIWNPEVFRGWNLGLEGDLKKAQDGFEHEFKEYEHLTDARTEIMADMLKNWDEGKTSDVDPARFEAFLRFSFRDGKMNGEPDQRLYFLIQGLALRNQWGQTILSPSVLNRFNAELLQNYPHFDFFIDKSSSKLDGRIVPDGTPNAREGGQWQYSDFVAWSDFLGDGEGTFNPKSGKSSAGDRTIEFFYHYLHMSVDARDRASRTQRSAHKNADHDDSKTLFAEWQEQEVNEALVRESAGTKKNSTDFWRVFISGFDQYMKMMRLYIQKGDADWGDASYWKDEKERVLQEIGSRLKIAMVTTQTLVGNYVGMDGRSAVFDMREYKKNSNYSPSLERSKEGVDTFMLKVLGEHGVRGEYEDSIKTIGVTYGTQDDARADRGAADGFGEVQAKISDLLADSVGGKFFTDTKVIESVLQQFE